MFALDGNSYITKWQPRPQGLPRGGARAEEDPGKINTAEKRLRMHQIMKIWRGI